MKISVALQPDSIDQALDLRESCAVVLDVLRATTVMTTAGAAGASEIVTCAQTETARHLAEETPDSSILCGERHCVKIDGFDCGNSPAEYTLDRVKGKRVILTTTNGTAAIESVRDARRVLVSSFLNLTATVEAIRNETSIRIVCAGTNGEITGEDVLLAGAIVDRLLQEVTSTSLNDSARIAQHSWRQMTDTGENVETALGQSFGGRNLQAVGYGDDIELCSVLDSVSGIVERVETLPQTFRYRQCV